MACFPVIAVAFVVIDAAFVAIFVWAVDMYVLVLQSIRLALLLRWPQFHIDPVIDNAWLLLQWDLGEVDTLVHNQYCYYQLYIGMTRVYHQARPSKIQQLRYAYPGQL